MRWPPCARRGTPDEVRAAGSARRAGPLPGLRRPDGDGCRRSRSRTSGRRARSGVPASRWPALAATRLALTRRRGRRLEADGGDDFGADELPETVAVAEWPVGETASGPGIAGHAAQDFPADDRDDQASGRIGARRSGPARLAARRRRRHGRAGYGRGEERAPWDMAGDWGSGGRRADPDPWGDDPWRDGWPARHWMPPARPRCQSVSETCCTRPWNETRPSGGARQTRLNGGATRDGAASPDRWRRCHAAPASSRLCLGKLPPSRVICGTAARRPGSASGRTGPQQPAVRDRAAAIGTLAGGPADPLSATGSEPGARPWDAGSRRTPTAWNRDTGEWEVSSALLPPARPADAPYPDEPAYPAEPAYPDEPAYRTSPPTRMSAPIRLRPNTRPSGRPGPGPGPRPPCRVRPVRPSRNATRTGPASTASRAGGAGRPTDPAGGES